MFRILTWNIACLPNIINLHMNPKKKIYKIIDEIYKTNSDIVCLQEVFDLKILNILEKELAKEYNIFYSNNNNYLSKNGLLTASKNNIDNFKEIEFKNSRSVEKIINKGVITIQINHNNFGNLSIHNTHMHSDTLLWPHKYSSMCRFSQHHDINNYLNLDMFNSYNHIICGDLNDDIDFIRKLKYNNFDFITNYDKIITFPFLDKQLDYICIDKNINSKNINYNVSNTILSDHNYLLCDIN